MQRDMRGAEHAKVLERHVVPRSPIASATSDSDPLRRVIEPLNYETEVVAVAIPDRVEESASCKSGQSHCLGEDEKVADLVVLKVVEQTLGANAYQRKLPNR